MPSIPVDLLGSTDFRVDFSSSDLRSGILKLTSFGNLSQIIATTFAISAFICY